MFYPEASNTVIFIIMAIVLLIKPAGLFGTPEDESTQKIAFVVMLAFFAGARRSCVYPVFLMKVMCFALFACAFNLLIGFGGLLSFGHAMFLGTAGYVAAHAAKVWGFPPELAILARHRRRGRCSAW